MFDFFGWWLLGLLFVEFVLWLIGDVLVCYCLCLFGNGYRLWFFVLFLRVWCGY